MLTAWRRYALAMSLVGLVFAGCRRPDSQANNSPSREASSASEPNPHGPPATQADPNQPVASQPASSDQCEDGSGGDQPNDGTASADSVAHGPRSSTTGGTPVPSGGGAASGNPRQPLAPEPAFKTPESAHQFAAARRTEAKQHAADGEEAEAYEVALNGWSALQPHLEDADCQKLSGELLAEIEQYGEALGVNGHEIVGKPLKIK